MKYILVQKEDKKYIECTPGGDNQLVNDQAALDLVAACLENDTHRLMLQADNFTPEFFQLKTGLAGSILLKFANYYLKVAAVLTPELIGGGRFQEMVLETNRASNELRVFYDHDKAEEWLLRD